MQIPFHDDDLDFGLRLLHIVDRADALLQEMHNDPNWRIRLRASAERRRLLALRPRLAVRIVKAAAENIKRRFILDVIGSVSPRLRRKIEKKLAQEMD